LSDSLLAAGSASDENKFEDGKLPVVLFTAAASFNETDDPVIRKSNNIAEARHLRTGSGPAHVRAVWEQPVQLFAVS
jgi:hypothetical protein